MHHGNPHHRLGPFKYELLHLDPEIGLYHQLISVQESENVKDLARGKMRSTPYIVDSKNEPFSKSRTSKVMYMNEKLVKEAMAMSNKVEWATRFRLKDEKYGSENYQVIRELVNTFQMYCMPNTQYKRNVLKRQYPILFWNTQSIGILPILQYVLGFKFSLFGVI